MPSGVRPEAVVDPARRPPDPRPAPARGAARTQAQGKPVKVDKERFESLAARATQPKRAISPV
ncbi:hypothetical protein ACFLIM_45770 [Nonomuraea sp. M3C6]|uniref:Uncharacterized protein n=1 Tax=Nonomuraea marmarensis TaxID=3351344 RepID=A0ABW7AWS9_9ACTN